jgi:pSer/pThr/pTyr-binding forkhead associated (FHA) protein
MSMVEFSASNSFLTADVTWQLHYSTGRGEPLRVVDIDAIRFRVGRRPDLQLTLPSLQVSGLHAEFIQVGLRLFVRDLNSTNGTFVNGNRIDHHDYALRPGDRVRMADIELIVHRECIPCAIADASGTIADAAAVLDTVRRFPSEDHPPLSESYPPIVPILSNLSD